MQVNDAGYENEADSAYELVSNQTVKHQDRLGMLIDESQKLI